MSIEKCVDPINAAMKAAFESKYSRDWNDPAGDDMKAIWAAAWQTCTSEAAQVALNEKLLTRAIRAVEEGLRSVGRLMPPDKHAKLIQAAYNLLGKLEASDKIDEQTVRDALAEQSMVVKKR